jgi:hypothetical protein
VESAAMGASSKRLTGRSSSMASPASVADRIRRRPGLRDDQPHPGAGWGTSAGDMARMGTDADVTTAPGIRSVADLDDVLPPGRRIGGPGPSNRPATTHDRTEGRQVSGGAAGTRSGSAPMGGRRPVKDAWGDGMINEADRGSAHDF